VDGGAIEAGVDAELDELRGISSTGRQSIAAIEERERQRTGIGSLKVRYNTVFGYYIEITRSNLAMAPADYERKQTLVNAERFTTPELKEYERKILTRTIAASRSRSASSPSYAGRCWRQRGAFGAVVPWWPRRICSPALRTCPPCGAMCACDR